MRKKGGAAALTARDTFDFDPPVGIQRGAHRLQVMDEEPIIDRERFVFALTSWKVGNVEGVWLKFCIMLTSLHVESESSALALAHVSACLMEGMGSVVTCPYSPTARALRRKAT